MPKRRSFTPDFKSKVALEALHGELTSQQIASKYKISTGQVSTFKQQAIDGIQQCFESTRSKSKKADDGPDVKSLHAKIGELTMERDFLSQGRFCGRA